MGKYLTKPYQSFGVGVGLLTGYKTAHWLRNVPLTSYSSSYTAKHPPASSTIVPAQRDAYHSMTSSGSFVMRASLHNRDWFSSARDDLYRPYSSYKDVCLHSNTSNLWELCCRTPLFPQFPLFIARLSGILSKFRSFLPISLNLMIC